MKLPNLSLTSPADDRYVKTADGLRVFCVAGVMWYHIWQQSWLEPSMQIFGIVINLNWLVRCGYLLVDGMLMLSGFLLFLPYARSAFDGSETGSVLSFYKRRAARILPSYYLSVLIMLFCSALPKGEYTSLSYAFKDIFSHLTLTHVFFPEGYTYTNLNVVLWTISIETQFYLIFPFIAKAFKKYPIGIYIAMVLAAFCYRDLFAAKQSDTTHLINQFPAMLDVYANGMLAAYVYVIIAKSVKENSALSLLSTILMVLCSVVIFHLFKGQLHESGYDNLRLGQMSRRYMLSLMFALFLLLSGFSLRPVKFLLGNRIMRFLSAISYQAYIWHSVIALRLKAWRIPAYNAPENPNMHGEVIWQHRYTFLCFALAIVAAIVLTYLYEKPLASLILRDKRKNKK
ncbi:MAG: acyltransferase [Clostridia bacterium]|nr:acyltransferase [Clostridia bacterium]MBQ4157925.1 acyltransferase [Clostridia bacterium]